MRKHNESYLDVMERELEEELQKSNLDEKARQEQRNYFKEFKHMRERQLYG
jgi:hypothetical protein